MNSKTFKNITKNKDGLFLKNSQNHRNIKTKINYFGEIKKKTFNIINIF